MAREFGGLGGIKGGREFNPGDLFEAAVERAMGDRLREAGRHSSLGSRLWGAMANTEWAHENGDTASYSFRAAGDLIAAIVRAGDYMDWYCSSPYPVADPEVVALMAAEGWSPVPESDEPSRVTP